MRIISSLPTLRTSKDSHAYGGDKPKRVENVLGLGREGGERVEGARTYVLDRRYVLLQRSSLKSQARSLWPSIIRTRVRAWQQKRSAPWSPRNGDDAAMATDEIV
jgi:hypothetical protein